MGSLNRLKASGCFSESLASQIPSNNYLKPTSLIRAHKQFAPSSLPPRFLKRPHHRREQVFEDGSCAEVDFGGDLHAGREAVKHAVGDEVLGLEVDQGAVGERQVAARFAGLLLVGRGVAGIGAEVGDPAFDHAEEVKGVSFALCFCILYLPFKTQSLFGFCYSSSDLIHLLVSRPRVRRTISCADFFIFCAPYSVIAAIFRFTYPFALPVFLIFYHLSARFPPRWRYIADTSSAFAYKCSPSYTSGRTVLLML